MAAKGITRRITRKQARSYERTSPNGGIGVTSIAAVNGRAKKRSVPAPVKRAMKDCGTSLKAAWKQVKKGKGKTKPKAKPRARRNASVSTPNYVRRYSATKAILRGGRGRARRNPTDMSGWGAFSSPAIADAEKAKKKAARAQKAAEKKTKERAMPKRKGAKKTASKATKRGSKRRTGVAKTYGKFKALRVRLGRKSVRTYLHATKKGARHIPVYALHGFKSKAAMEKARKTDKGFERIQTRGAAIGRARTRAAKRVMEHGDIFTPNTTVIPFSEWSKSMTPNKRKAKKKAKKSAAKGAKLLTKRQKAARKGLATKRRNAKLKAASKKAPRKTAKRKAAKRKASSKKGKRLTKRQKAARKGLATKRRNAKAKAGGRKAAKRRGSRKSAKKSVRRSSKKRGGSKASHRAAALKGIRRKKARGGKKVSRKGSSRRRAKRNGALVATPNRRHHRHFRKNGYMEQLKAGLKVGAVIVGGFLVHKAVSKLIADQGLSRVAFFQGPSVAPYQSLIAGVLAAAIGIPLAARFLKAETANQVAGGMAASLLHAAIVTVLSKFTQTQAVVPYFAGYGDATGEYVGTGEYVEAMQGFGAWQQYGAMQQAAAGFGLQQAAAGYGTLQQAAAGTGEYVARGVEGYGEYVEEMSGFGDNAAYTYDGIPGGDLSAAEHALNVAEAAAGLGDLATASTVDPLLAVNAGSVGPGSAGLTLPTIQGVPGLPGPQAVIPANSSPNGQDDSHSGRRGILAGGDGIFGGCNPMQTQRDWQ